MVMARLAWALRRIGKHKRRVLTSPRCENALLMTFLACISLVVASCGQTAKTVVSPATGQVNTYFGGPFVVLGSPVNRPSVASIDHYGNQVAVSGAIVNSSTGVPAKVPVNTIAGTFTSAPTGFLSITESYTTPASGTPVPQNPPVTGAWAVEIPGAGTLANFQSVYDLSSPSRISAAPIAMAQNTSCPTPETPSQFLYVTVPHATMVSDVADYGIVAVGSQGSAVTFSSQPFLIGSIKQASSVVTGGCSQTLYGSVTTYPLNSFGGSGPLPELISIGISGLLVSSFDPALGGLGAFGGGTGVLGVAEPSSPIDPSSVSSAMYNGFIFSPENPIKQGNGYDITVLASAFGDHPSGSQPCSVLQTSLAANSNGLVPKLPSPNSIYGGEFLTVTAGGTVNDPTGAIGSGNCDVAIDLGTQDGSNNGLFPNATVFIGANFPPFSDSNPWNCPTGGVCAVSFPAAAIVGQVEGRYVVFVTTSVISTPPAQLPDGTGTLQVQPVGIYLFQR